MESILRDINKKIDRYSNIFNALTVGMNVIASGTNLDYMSKKLCAAKNACDYETALVAFDVLNCQCGDKLPMPLMFCSNWPSTPAIPTSESNFNYTEKMHVAADMLCSLNKYKLEIKKLEAKMRSQSVETGGLFDVFLMMVKTLYK